MILPVLILLFLICLWGLQFSKRNDGYLSLESTNAIKGIFAVIILCSHMGGYLQFEDNLANRSYFKIMEYLAQSMVAPYLFYSGYGIYYSFRNKENYASGFFRKRFLKTLINFDLAVLIFVVVQALVPIKYPLRNYLLCWVGWESVGNSNWFIFVILALYLIAFIGLFAEKKKKGALLPLIILSSFALWLFLRIVAHKESWWCDTIAAFPLGMLYYAHQDKIDKFLLDGKTWRWALALCLVSGAYVVWHHLMGVDVFGICSCIFCLLITVFTMRIKIGNPILNWLGKHAFAIYILQRLPMLLMAHYGVHLHPGVFIPAAIILTFLLAEGFNRLTDKISFT